MMEIVQLNQSLLDDLCAFMERLQKHKEHAIGYIEPDRDKIKRFMLEEVVPDWKKQNMLVLEDGKILGMLGVIYDLELQRAWIHGPLIDLDNLKSWNTVAEKLYSALAGIIPEAINDYEMCGYEENTRLRAFAEGHGFKVGTPAYVYGRSLENVSSDGTDGIEELTGQYHDQFITLHERIFPGTYFNGKQLIEQLSGTKKIFIACHEDEVTGYIFLQAFPENDDAYIDFLGVKEDFRRKGLASKLVLKSLEWLNKFGTVERISLTVSQRDEGARSLYEKLGFSNEYTMQGYRLKL